MLYQGKAFTYNLNETNGIGELCFNLEGQSANVLNQVALKELTEVTAVIKKQNKAKGLILTSGKDQFVLGADIFEFMQHFKKTKDELVTWLTETNNTFSIIEDLPYPTVSAINGFAFGGGFEISLTTDFRVIEEQAKVGLLEAKLGLIPGWGGTVRLSRLTGADHAIEWITSGNQYSAQDAYKIRAVDSLVKKGEARASALTLLERAMAGTLDWKNRRTKKTSPLTLNKIEFPMVFETSKGYVAGIAGPNYPAPLAAIDTMSKGAFLKREDALKIESEHFADLCHHNSTSSLVSVFLGDQYLKKQAKKWGDQATAATKGAVIGAGIMGGGISYQAASKGVKILMKDIMPKALDAGMKEAGTLVLKALERGKVTPQNGTETLARITPVMSFGEFQDVDMVIEAVVENKDVKMKVLAEVENSVGTNTLLASNTSTIPISDLATGLKRPEHFCGMHFFNPVPKMPLVEIIRGKKTSEQTIARAVKYATQMGKTAIVVNDCPGFLVNRVLFPYFFGLVTLIEDGVDFRRVDKVMEKFGWPMGPAYLLDVIGVDTGFHAAQIMGKSYPDRMQYQGKTVLSEFFEKKRFGQKNGVGFYHYETDAKGKVQKVFKEEVMTILDGLVKNKTEMTDEEIVERMMIPMIFECMRCLEEKIVETPTEIDMGLMLGLGFPPFRFGALKYADDIGLKNISERAKIHERAGSIYKAPQLFNEYVNSNRKIYQ